jgi:hypothetical protein
MDGSSGSGVQLSSAQSNGGGGGSSGASGSNFKNSINLYTGPSGSLRRTWRLNITPLAVTNNALEVQYLDENGLWKNSSVMLSTK